MRRIPQATLDELRQVISAFRPSTQILAVLSARDALSFLDAYEEALFEISMLEEELYRLHEEIPFTPEP